MDQPNPTQGQPKYEVGQRVTNGGHSGRVQNVAYADGTFRYDVKWDNGPTTSHLEGALTHENLPPHYP